MQALLSKVLPEGGPKEDMNAVFSQFDAAIKKGGYKTDTDLFRTQMELAFRDLLSVFANRVLASENGDNAMETDGGSAEVLAECSAIVDLAIKGEKVEVYL